MFRKKLESSEESRKEESRKIKEQWPEKVPLILEKDRTNEIEDLGPTKFLCPKNYSISRLLQNLRQKLHMRQELVIFLLANEETLLSNDMLLGEAYEKYGDEDGFLYLLYTSDPGMG